MTPGDKHLVDLRIAQNAVAVALVNLLALHDQADEVRLQASLKEGRLDVASVEFVVMGRVLGGFDL